MAVGAPTRWQRFWRWRRKSDPKAWEYVLLGSAFVVFDLFQPKSNGLSLAVKLGLAIAITSFFWILMTWMVRHAPRRAGRTMFAAAYFLKSLVPRVDLVSGIVSAVIFYLVWGILEDYWLKERDRERTDVMGS